MPREKKPPKVREVQVGVLMPIALSTEDAAKYLGLKPEYLRKWRSAGSSEGRPAPPPHVKLDSAEHGKVIYWVDSITKWRETLTEVVVP